MKIENNTRFNKSDLKPHKGLWILIQNQKEEVLMVFHKKFDEWTIILDKTEENEDLHDAIVRSAKEEIGIEIEKYEIIDTIIQNYLRNNVQLEIEAYLIKVTDYNGKPVNLEPEKHEELAWKDKRFISGLSDRVDANVYLKDYFNK